MTRVRWCLAAVVAGSAACVAACGSGSRPGAAPDNPDGGGFHLDGSPFDVIAPQEAAPGEASSGEGGPGDAGDAGDGGDAVTDGPPTAQPQCGENEWTTMTPVASVPTTGFERFGAISAQETTIAWTETGGAVFVADRGSPGASFGTPQAVDTSATPVADDRIAMTPNGLELIATLEDRSTFVTFIRQSVSSAWIPDTGDTEFQNVRALGSEGGGKFSEPVVSADGLSLFFLFAGGTQPPAMYEAPWDLGTKSWDPPNSLQNPELTSSSASAVRRPTGVSSDRRTLFFFDEAAGIERVTWRDYPTSPFFFFDDLPIAPEAAPSGACTTLYIQSGETDAGGAPGVATAQ